ncbi:MAG: hypothetical protein DRI84_08175 [Bacteroidetes bacterium]|nr:MAG: hypothetical protein DRI84_08175 [Bacteroidota bacterium]
MSEFCTCTEFKNICEDHPTLFKLDDSYGWIVKWIELTQEDGYTKVHTYGISIKHCPLCGKELGDKYHG